LKGELTHLQCNNSVPTSHSMHCLNYEIIVLIMKITLHM